MTPQCQKVGCTKPVGRGEVYCPTCQAAIDALNQRLAEEYACYGSEIGVRR